MDDDEEEEEEEEEEEKEEAAGRGYVRRRSGPVPLASSS